MWRDVRIYCKKKKKLIYRLVKNNYLEANQARSVKSNKVKTLSRSTIFFNFNQNNVLPYALTKSNKCLKNLIS